MVRTWHQGTLRASPGWWGCIWMLRAQSESLRWSPRWRNLWRARARQGRRPHGRNKAPGVASAALWGLGVAELAGLIRRNEISPAELLDSVLARIEGVEGLVHAFVTLDTREARSAAAALTREAIAGYFRGPFHGVPIAVKDIIDVQGIPTQRGSSAFADARPAAADAAVVSHLRRAGAIILGKTVTHEFACGVYSPPTRNPWALERSAGGSSGGSAAAVAAGEALAALGSDTGGSIRIPAALCGVVGIKPTYGSVDASGSACLSWSLDHLGAIARSASDAALVLEAMGWSGPQPSVRLWAPMAGVLESAKIAVPRELTQVADPEVTRAFEGACRQLRASGAVVREVTIPALRWAAASETAIFMSEAASCYQHELRSQPRRIGPEVRTLLQAGAILPSALYLRAQELRGRICDDIDRALESSQCHFLCCPTVPMPAYRPEETTWEQVGEPIVNAVTRGVTPFNLCGRPAISLPMGLSEQGLPLGLQFVAARYGEPELIGLAKDFEEVGGWQHVHPSPLDGQWSFA